MRILKTAVIILVTLTFASACVLLPAILANNNDSARVNAFSYFDITPAPETELRALRSATVEALSKLSLQNTYLFQMNAMSLFSPHIQSNDIYINADEVVGANKTSLSRLESLIQQCGYGSNAVVFQYAQKTFAELNNPDVAPDTNFILQYSEDWLNDTHDWSSSYYLIVDGYSGQPVLFTTSSVYNDFIYMLRENLTSLNDSRPEIMKDAYALFNTSKSELLGQVEITSEIAEGDIASLLLAPDDISLSYALSQSDEYLAVLLGLDTGDGYYSNALEIYIDYATHLLKLPDDAPGVAAKLANELSVTYGGAALAEQIYFRLDVLNNQGEDALREIRDTYTSIDSLETEENSIMPTAALNSEFAVEKENAAADIEAEFVGEADYSTKTSASSIAREAALKTDMSAMSYNELLAYCTLYTPELSRAIYECAVAALEKYPEYSWLSYVPADGCTQLPQESLLGWADCTLDTSVQPTFRMSSDESFIIAHYSSVEQTFGVDVVFAQHGAVNIYLVIDNAR